MKKKEKLEPFSPDIISLAALFIISLRDEEAVSVALKRRGVNNDNVSALIRKARDRIALCAEVNRREELAKTLARMDAQYEAVSDFSIAQNPRDRVSMVTAAREITDRRAELLDLKNNVDIDALNESVKSQTEEFTRKHLESIQLVPAGLPLEELARRIALHFINTRTSSTTNASIPLCCKTRKK